MNQEDPSIVHTTMTTTIAGLGKAASSVFCDKIAADIATEILIVEPMKLECWT